MTNIGLKLLGPLVSFLAASSLALHAADLRSLSVVTDHTLELYLVDGHIIHYGLRGDWDGPANTVFHAPLDVAAAMTPSRYAISSTNDPDFANPVLPTRIHRKSRVIDVNSTSTEPKFIFGHWIYLSLPKSLKSGKAYTIAMRNVAENMPTARLILDPTRHRSPSIHVNQVGFAPASPKFAYLSLWMGTGGGADFSSLQSKTFTIRRYDNHAEVFRGPITPRMDATTPEMPADVGNLTRASLWQCDFSSLTTPGEYIVSIDSLGCSYPFEISNDILREPFWYAMKGLFFQRAGIVRELEPNRIYPRDHHPDDIRWFYLPDVTKSEISGDGNLTNGKPLAGCFGFYHDAGDWDSYASHSAVPFSLMLLYTAAPTRFADGDVGNRYKLNQDDPNWINEANNGLPDILDEAAWLPTSCRRLRKALIDAGYTDGGVPSYLGREAIAWAQNYGKGILPSWEDKRDWAVNRVCPEATIRYAAMAAWYAHCLNLFHRLTNPGAHHPQSQPWINEARSAYQWAIRNKPQPKTQFPGYAALAAICLYQVTHDPTYQHDFKAFRAADTTRGYAQVDIWPWFFYEPLYAMLPDNLPALDKAAQLLSRDAVLHAGQHDAQYTESKIGFRAFQITTMHGQLANPRFLSLAAAHALSQDPTLLHAMQNSASYLLGGNQRNTVYLTCLGENPDNIIFHPDAWILNDFKHKAYQWEPLPGYGTYFGQLFDYVGGPGAEKHVQLNAYPDFNLWPKTEMRSGNRESISGNEFTIHQNNIHIAFAMGYLRATGAGPGGFLPQPRPTVRLRLRDNHPIKPGNAFTLLANASPNTRLVKYYQDWRFIGESDDAKNAFPVPWTPDAPNGATIQITAVAYNDRGRISLPSPNGQKIVLISTATEPPTKPHDQP